MYILYRMTERWAVMFFNCSLQEGKAYMGRTEGFTFLVPKTKFFQKLTLTDVSKEEIESVEKAGNK